MLCSHRGKAAVLGIIFVLAVAICYTGNDESRVGRFLAGKGCKTCSLGCIMENAECRQGDNTNQEVCEGNGFVWCPGEDCKTCSLGCRMENGECRQGDNTNQEVCEGNGFVWCPAEETPPPTDEPTSAPTDVEKGCKTCSLGCRMDHDECRQGDNTNQERCEGNGFVWCPAKETPPTPPPTDEPTSAPTDVEKGCKTCSLGCRMDNGECRQGDNTNQKVCEGNGFVWCPAKAAQMNVLFLLIDDLSDDHTSGYPLAPELKKVGVTFAKNYANHPICAPSRASLLTGILGVTSGNLYFGEWYENAVLSQSKTLMEHFKAHGYATYGSGKMMHHELEEPSDGHWDEFYRSRDYGPYAYDRDKRKFRPHPDLSEAIQAEGKTGCNFGRISRVPFGGVRGSGYAYSNRTQMYVNPSDYTDRDLMPDEINAEWAINKIKALAVQLEPTPFFLAVGFTKPHTPMYCPDNYFDMFPEEDILLPFEVGWNGVDGIPYWDVTQTTSKGRDFYDAVTTSYDTPTAGLKKFRQAYYACRAFVSDLADKVVLALKGSPFWENTVVVFTSDNGWNDGAHKFVFKNAPWELATSVPLIIRAPGFLEGAEVVHPTSLIDIYPTLVELCGLTSDNRKSNAGALLDGHSLKPFLLNPLTTSWTGPDGASSLSYVDDSNKVELPGSCVEDATCHHWSVRTTHMRYILYNTGQEEMFNITADIGEKVNLALTPRYDEVKADARAALEQSSKIKLDQLGHWTQPKFCNDYCSGSSAEWSSKCAWADCAHCSACAAEQVVVDLPTCKSWCGAHGSSWEEKCAMKKCQDCSPCSFGGKKSRIECKSDEDCD